MELLTQLANHGVLGLIAAISIVGNVMQYRQRENLWEKRAEDLAQWRDQTAIFREDTTKLTEGVKETTDKILLLLQTGSKRRPL